ncbi:metallophosphoesterase family protein [Rhizobium leguminosarum]|uniref:metallophosphoesterase family protein n=1 Tax=Rhizobium leguminosarum TaxID=384 RepID=UPI001C92A5E9|nr:metallophosphoesterase [Rhizobium leguminosarum]MBY2937188.1 metallophosphoesterase [Rhizobium leguminosarum]
MGTGARPALDVLRAITAQDPDILIHLGDIYYSGTQEECRKSFMEPIEQVFRQGATRPVYTLPGNHDIYCGGVGFYDLISKLNPAPFTQPASFFCLRAENEKWQFLAMDTGQHDRSPYSVAVAAADATTRIEDDELEWLCDRMREFTGKTILLSHHQLFSAYSGIGPEGKYGSRDAVNPNLLKAFRELTSAGDVSAWFWGA